MGGDVCFYEPTLYVIWCLDICTSFLFSRTNILLRSQRDQTHTHTHTHKHISVNARDEGRGAVNELWHDASGTEIFVRRTRCQSRAPST
jgi:hypothetical protein